MTSRFCEQYNTYPYYWKFSFLRREEERRRHAASRPRLVTHHSPRLHDDPLQWRDSKRARPTRSVFDGVGGDARVSFRIERRCRWRGWAEEWNRISWQGKHSIKYNLWAVTARPKVSQNRTPLINFNQSSWHFNATPITGKHLPYIRDGLGGLDIISTVHWTAGKWLSFSEWKILQNLN